MAESVIKLTNEFIWHPKTLELKRRIGAEGVLSLISLWIWANNNRPDGELTNMDSKAIATAANWNGDPWDFVKSCIFSGFFDQEEDGSIQLHDWKKNNEYAGLPQTIRERAQKAVRARWDKAKAKA